MLASMYARRYCRLRSFDTIGAICAAKATAGATDRICVNEVLALLRLLACVFRDEFIALFRRAEDDSEPTVAWAEVAERAVLRIVGFDADFIKMPTRIAG